MRTWGNKLAMTAWKRWRIWRLQVRWHGPMAGWFANRNDLMRHDKSAELHPSEVESPAQKYAKMLCLSLPYLVSRIIWVTQFNLWKQVSIRNSVRSPRRFVYWINWFKNSFCSPINTLPAFLSPRVLEAPPYPNGTTHNLAYMSQRRNGHKQTVTNPTIGQTLHTRIHENSLSDLFRFNMIQPELIAIPAILHDTTVLQAMLRCVLSLATLQKGSKRQNSFTLFMNSNHL